MPTTNFSGFVNNQLRRLDQVFLGCSDPAITPIKSSLFIIIETTVWSWTFINDDPVVNLFCWCDRRSKCVAVEADGEQNSRDLVTVATWTMRGQRGIMCHLRGPDIRVFAWSIASLMSGSLNDYWFMKCTLKTRPISFILLEISALLCTALFSYNAIIAFNKHTGYCYRLLYILCWSV